MATAEQYQALDKLYGKGAAEYLKKNGVNATTKQALRDGSWKATPTSYKPGQGNSISTQANKSGYTQDDYNIDISDGSNKAKSRKEEMTGNLDKNAEYNSKVFENKSDYDTAFNTASKSNSQQNLQNQYYDESNKYGLTATQNLYARNASQVQKDKNAAMYGDLKKNLTAKNKEWEGIKDNFNKNVQDLMNQYDNTMNIYLKQSAQLRDLQNSYYRTQVREMNEASAGAAASMASQLSGQGVATGVINSSLGGIENQYASKYNDLLGKHIETLSKLNDDYQNFMRNILNDKGNLNNNQFDRLKTYMAETNSIITELGKIDAASASEYAPYETTTNQKVTSAAEGLASSAKFNSAQSEYAKADKNGRMNILKNYLVTWFGDESKAADYAKYLSDAANYDGITEGMTYIVRQSGLTSPSKANNAASTILKFSLDDESTRQDVD